MSQGIKSDIILNDKMTSVLRDIVKAMDVCSQAMDDMEKNGKKAFDEKDINEFEQAVKQAKGSLYDFEEKIEDSGEAAEESSSKFEKFKSVLGKIGKVGAAVGTAVAGAMTAIGVGIGKIAKEAVESYSNYEQLVGGVETLFGNGGLSLKQYAKQEGQTVAEAKKQYRALTAAQNEALKNANNAYKTAGMSANEYMEVSTGFAASLVSSLGGDTNKAVKYADMAVIDMSDNANKMGSDIESIKNAYQGFAKQNFTMLDNLKLGYGGTQEEMKRLLADAQKLSGQKYDISSFADITEAIHVMQKEMNIACTTAKEAKGTIQGSISMMKSSWQNMLTALVTGGDQYEQCIDNLVSSVTIAANNLMPAVEGALNGIGALIADLAPIIAEKLPEMLNDVLPGLLEAVTTIFGALGSALPGLLETLVAQLPDIMTMLSSVFNGVFSTLMTLMPQIIPVLVEALLGLVDAIVENLPLFLDAAVQLVTALIQGLAEAAPELVPAMVTAITTMVQGLVENAPLLISAALQLLQALADGLIASLPTLLSALPQIIVGIQNFLIENQTMIMEAGITLLTSIIDALPMVISLICAALPQLIFAMVTNMLSHVGDFISAGIQLIGALIQGIMACNGAVVQLVVGLGSQMVASIKAFVSNMKTVGGDLLKGLWNGISDAVSWVIERVRGVGSKILSAIKGVFGVKSPSKEFAKIGDFLMQGLGNGVADNAKYAVTATEGVAKDVLAAASGLSANAQIGATFTGMTGSASDLDGGTYDIMRNYAAQDSVNKFTTAQVNIDMGGVVNQIASGADVDDLITRFVEGVREKLSTASLGVH